MDTQKLLNKYNNREPLSALESIVIISKSREAAAELAALRERAEKAEEKVKSVTALMNEWRYIAIEKPMPTDRAIGLEACAEELEAALKGDA